MKKVIVYPGRFQPMLSHHAEVYRQLQASNPDADVYIGTSDKVEGEKSPFNFKEKKAIAKAHGIDPNKILIANRPYHKDEYPQFKEDDTVLIFAVGEKDLDRFPMSDIDPNTGLNMTKKGDRPTYYQKIETMDQEILPMSHRGYIMLSPTIKVGDDAASASAFRQQLKDAPDQESAKQLFTKQFGEYNEQVFQLIYDKIVRTDMKEQMDILRQLAGLPVTEAPVNMRPAHGDDDATKLIVGIGHLLQREANKRPMGKGTPDSELEFQNKMSEIGGSMVAGKYKTMADLVGAIKGAGDAEQVAELKELMLKLMQDYKDGDRAVGLKPGEKSEYDREGDPDAFDDAEESVDLSDIRSEYDIEEGDGTEHHCKACDGSGCEECDDTGIDAHFRRQEESSEGGPTPSQMSDEDLADYIGASVEEVRADREAAEEAADDKSRDHAEYGEAVEETTTNALDAALAELRKLSGL